MNSSTNRLSSAAMTDILKATGTKGEITENVLKIANREIKISAKDQFNGFNKIIPFFEKLQEKNSGYRFKVKLDGIYTLLLFILYYNYLYHYYRK